jgi:GT2 family glycosyltransferase|tara:strand:- start:623 stop:1165 length:543 start_codon:yes stop_codon:yes gene_type:complete
MNIYTFIPYDLDKNLGDAYNRHMNLLKDDDWAVILDHDAMFVQKDWMVHIEKVIKENPEYGFFTCMMNRVGSKWQIPGGIDKDNHDMFYHMGVGKKLRAADLPVVDVTNFPYLSGVVMIVKKSVWDKIGGAPDGMLGVDGQLHIRCQTANVKVGLMPSLYVYHWYRGDGQKNHLENKEGY